MYVSIRSEAGAMKVLCAFHSNIHDICQSSCEMELRWGLDLSCEKETY